MSEDGVLSIFVEGRVINLYPSDVTTVAHDISVVSDKGVFDLRVVWKYEWDGNQLKISREAGSGKETF